MKRVFRWVFLAVLLGAAALALMLWKEGPTYREPLSAPAEPEAPPPPVAPPESAIRYPVPEQAEKPLPPLEKSDPAVLAALADLFGRGATRQFFQPPEIVRRIVVTVDNLPRKVVSAQLMPTRPVGGKLRTIGEGDARVLAAANHDRYTPFIRLAQKVDAKQFAAIYAGLYPLFQQAYRELGYPKGYFNDRLVAVIDHMLEARESDGPIALVQPRIYYRFADPELESLSAGHKLMLRIGNDHAATVKKKLREIRAELVAFTPKED